MIKDGSPTETTQKKSYAKPLISEVKLRPEEAVLGNCKISAAAGPVSSSCDTPTACSALAS
jgi:hypothetical protein